MKTIAQLREERLTLLSRAEAITALATEEDRDLTVDERTEYDSIIDEKAGKIVALDADIKRSERLRQLQVEAALKRNPLPDKPESEDRKIIVPATALRCAKPKHYDLIEDAYTAGMWFIGAVCGHAGARKWCDEHGVSIQGALTTSQNQQGGFLVPMQMETAIIRLVEETGVFRRFAGRFPMTSDHAVVPRRSSGLTAYFVGDNAEITASDVAWDQVELTARKLGALCKYSSELSEDAAVSIGDIITEEIAYAFAYKEDACGFLGTGASTYGHIQGLISVIAAGSIVTAITGNTTFATLDLADFESMIGKIPAYPGINPAWFIHKAGWAASMQRLQDAAGGNTIATLAGGAGAMFLGYPVVFTQAMNSTLTAQTSTSGICYFGDLRMGSLFGDRRGITITASSERYFELDQLAIKGTERFDISIHGRGTASVPGPIIMLKTPSS